MSTNAAAVVDGGESTTVINQKKRSGRPIDPNSKSRRCLAIYQELHPQGKSRQEILKAFIDRVGVGQGSAQVYYHEAKNGGKKPTKKNAQAKQAASAAVVNDTSAPNDSDNNSGSLEV